MAKLMHRGKSSDPFHRHALKWSHGISKKGPYSEIGSRRKGGKNHDAALSHETPMCRLHLTTDDICDDFSHFLSRHTPVNLTCTYYNIV